MLKKVVIAGSASLQDEVTRAIDNAKYSGWML